MHGMCGSRAAALTLVAALVVAPAPGRAAELTQVRVNAFPNAKALPLHAGIATGIFARHGIDELRDKSDHFLEQQGRLVQVDVRIRRSFDP